MHVQLASLLYFGDAASAGKFLQNYLRPVMAAITAIATLTCAGYLVNGGIQYAASSGNPDHLRRAKRIIKNAAIGLALVLCSTAIVESLTHIFIAASPTVHNTIPTFAPINPAPQSSGLVTVLIDAIVGLLLNIIATVGAPFMEALAYFTHATPLMSHNPSVFNLWLAMVAMADALFVIVVALLGMHVMSYATFGLQEVDIKQLLPQIIGVFLVINMSIFAIDAIISLSNALIYALESAFPSTSVWLQLAAITKQAGGMGVAALILMTIFLSFSIMLLVYYVCRIVVLYLGAVLAPLVLLLWLIPSFKDFAATAARLYLVTIFVLFVQVVILQLASSIFGTVLPSSPSHSTNSLMAMIVGLATVLSLLRTQSVISQMSYASIGPKTARQLGGQFINGMSYVTSKLKSEPSTVSVAIK